MFFILCSEPSVAITATSTSPVTDGSPVMINCTASGNGVTRTVLRRNGMEASGMTNSMLTIDSFTDDPYAGTYDCLVENPIGMALSQGLRLDTCKSFSCVWISVACYHSPSLPPSHALVATNPGPGKKLNKTHITELITRVYQSFFLFSSSD